MSDAVCRPCESRGHKRIATRMVPRLGGGNTPKCDDCWKSGAEVLAPIGRDHPEAHTPAPAPAPLPTLPKFHKTLSIETEEALPIKRSTIDWKEVQRERSAGATVKELAAKYGCHEASIYNHTKGTAGGKRAAHAAAGKIRRQFRDQAAAAAPPAALPALGPDSIAQALAFFKDQRAKLDRVIAVLEEVNGAVRSV